MPRTTNDEFSLSMDSVFDWGSMPSHGSGKRDASVGMSTLTSATGAGHVSRYDPSGMNRIVDINDLVDDSTSDSDEDNDDAVIGGSKSSMEVVTSDVEKGGGRRQKDPPTHLRAGGSPLWYRQAVILVAIVGIVVAASVAIGFAVNNSDPNKRPYSIVAEAEGGGSMGAEQKMLELAERVVTACGENRLNEDMSECQKLCHSNMCCFDSGKYSCADDESKDCAVYAGCEALVEGVPVGAAEEDEE